jgi:hypothetical protein
VVLTVKGRNGAQQDKRVNEMAMLASIARLNNAAGETCWLSRREDRRPA